jgi:hypothetical protein
MRLVLNLHGKRVAYLEARCRMLERVAKFARQLSIDDGKDVAIHDIGEMILDLRRAGRSDAEILEGIEELIVLRMMAGLPEAVSELTEGEL